MTRESSRLAAESGLGTKTRQHQQVQLRPINWLARLVARIPARIRTKLLVSLAVMVVVLVIIGGLGLRVLGESNARFGTLATLQQKAATYRALQNQNIDLHELVTARMGLFPSVAVPSDETVESTLRQFRESYDLRRRVAVEGRRRAEARRRDPVRLRAACRRDENAIELDRAGRGTEGQQLLRTQAVPVSDRIVSATDQLASNAESRIAALVSDNSARVTTTPA